MASFTASKHIKITMHDIIVISHRPRKRELICCRCPSYLCSLLHTVQEVKAAGTHTPRGAHTIFDSFSTHTIYICTVCRWEAFLGVHNIKVYAICMKVRSPKLECSLHLQNLPLLRLSVCVSVCLCRTLTYVFAAMRRTGTST